MEILKPATWVRASYDSCHCDNKDQCSCNHYFNSCSCDNHDRSCSNNEN